MEWYLERIIRGPVHGIVKALGWRDCRMKQTQSNLKQHQEIGLEGLHKGTEVVQFEESWRH